MDEYASLSHSKWECKYHVVFIPKCRRKTLYGELRKHLGEVFRKLAQQKESRIEEGHLMPDHVHMMISIPPKYAVSQVVGFMKGKSAIHLARVYGEKKRNFVGQHFWARGYFVSTVGRDEAVIRDQKPGARGRPLGPNEFVALIGRLQVANECRAASATLTAASSGPIPKAPGSAGGYLP
jgi:putative transposase